MAFPEIWNYVQERLKVVEGKTMGECLKEVPKIHVGIIPDGNRRWCKKNNKTVNEYAKMIEEVLYAAYENHKSEEDIPFETFLMVGELSVYVLSKDNLLKRNDETLKFIETVMDIVCSLMRIDSINSRVKIDVIGDRSVLPKTIDTQISTCERLSRGTFPIHFALGYDPVEDSASYIEAGMQTRTPIDVVIRSGGELRSSGFFPMQTLYSEWVYFTELWPEMSAGKMHEALVQFMKRKRNFGK
jgi:undecaprenyl diphosphate synthase